MMNVGGWNGVRMGLELRQYEKIELASVNVPAGNQGTVETPVVYQQVATRHNINTKHVV